MSKFLEDFLETLDEQSKLYLRFWLEFFGGAGIEGGFEEAYAIAFTEHRIKWDMLLDLDETMLSEIGIVGNMDNSAIINHAKAIYENMKNELMLQEAARSKEANEDIPLPEDSSDSEEEFDDPTESLFLPPAKTEAKMEEERLLPAFLLEAINSTSVETKDSKKSDEHKKIKSVVHSVQNSPGISGRSSTSKESWSKLVTNLHKSSTRESCSKSDTKSPRRYYSRCPSTSPYSQSKTKNVSRWSSATNCSMNLPNGPNESDLEYFKAIHNIGSSNFHERNANNEDSSSKSPYSKGSSALDCSSSNAATPASSVDDDSNKVKRVFLFDPKPKKRNWNQVRDESPPPTLLDEADMLKLVQHYLANPVRIQRRSWLDTSIPSSQHEHIDSDNVGFQMLRKLGWNRGSRLGNGQNGVGLKDPLPIDPKTDRLGLGAEKIAKCDHRTTKYVDWKSGGIQYQTDSPGLK